MSDIEDSPDPETTPKIDPMQMMSMLMGGMGGGMGG